MSKVKLPIDIVTKKWADGVTHTALVDGAGNVLTEINFGADILKIGEIVEIVNGTRYGAGKGKGNGNGNGRASDTRKTALASVDALTQAFWADATAPADEDASDIRRTAFQPMNDAIAKAVMAYWKKTEGTR